MKRRVTSSLVLIFCSIGLCGIGSPSAFASSKYLSVPYYSQYGTGAKNWCWAASSKSVSVYLGGSNVSVCQYVKWGTKQSTCNDTPGGATEIKRALNSSGIRNAGMRVDRAFNSAEITKEINNGFPFMVRWKYTNQSIGHLVVARGYTTDPGQLVLSLVDPAKGYSSGTFEWVKNGNGHIWNQTYYGFRK
ncbi:papain-like cysteine protease family protein [Bifidobacterium jacchi]|uniref:Peptidase C39-like domain-containing protein n=1 Tax=Bifidobacterium jacchi TaxID=2490545 RepID=A0A5N5RF75_9BIFI|nr:hypothetical protein EHS19_09330 [Bifidobacterium jacchi]